MKTKTMIQVMLVIASLMILFQLLDFVSLHDIYNDYASKSVITQFASDRQFPDWTNTPGEWTGVNFSYIVRFFMILSLFIILVIVNRKVKN